MVLSENPLDTDASRVSRKGEGDHHNDENTVENGTSLFLFTLEYSSGFGNVMDVGNKKVSPPCGMTTVENMIDDEKDILDIRFGLLHRGKVWDGRKKNDIKANR
jgi:hypothetical protein